MRSRRSVTALAVAAAVACSACASQSSSSQRATDAQASSTAAPTSRSPHKRPARHRRRRRPAHAARTRRAPLRPARIARKLDSRPAPARSRLLPRDGLGQVLRTGSVVHPRCPESRRHSGDHRSDDLHERLQRDRSAHPSASPTRRSSQAWPRTVTADRPSDYEYDHLVSLELGGAANDPRNLWPEPGNSPNPKDSIENSLHRLVCSGQMPLAQAQKIIATRWIAYYRSNERQAQASPSPSAPSSAPTRRAGPTSRSRRSTARTSRRMPPPRAGSIDTAALRATTSPASTATTTASPANRSRRPGVPKTTGAAPAGGRRRPRPGRHGSR